MEAPARTKSQPNGHPADGMTIHVPVQVDGETVTMDILDPRSFADGGLEWIMRYGNPESVRYTVASVLASYDYLLSGEITTKEANHRLHALRAMRALALSQQPQNRRAPCRCPQNSEPTQSSSKTGDARRSPPTFEGASSADT